MGKWARREKKMISMKKKFDDFEFGVFDRDSQVFAYSACAGWYNENSKTSTTTHST